MNQQFEGNPQAEIHLNGRRLVRTEVTHDWGLRLQWEIKRNGQVIATPNARPDFTYEHSEATPGNYEVVLQMWKYIDYAKNPAGEFTNSRWIEVSNRVAYTI